MYNSPETGASTLYQSSFSTAPYWTTAGETDQFGYQDSGFLFNTALPALNLRVETWLIGTPGEFTSVWQELGGDNFGGSSVNFVLTDSNGTFAAGSPAYSPVPEPGISPLLGTGALGFFATIRRKSVR